MSVRLRQVTSGYVRLCQFTSEGRDVELDNICICNHRSKSWFVLKKCLTPSHAMTIISIVFMLRNILPKSSGRTRIFVDKIVNNDKKIQEDVTNS